MGKSDEVAKLLICILKVHYLNPGQYIFTTLDIVGTVYNLVICMQSNKIHKVFLMIEFYSSHMLARHVSDLTGPSSGAFFLQAVCADLVCGTTVRTTRHVQRLQSNGWTCRVVRVLQHIPKKNAPEDGPVRSETCRANICDE